MEYQGYDITGSLAIIPKLQRLLHTFRSAGFPVYHTRQGKPKSLPCAVCFTDSY